MVSHCRLTHLDLGGNFGPHDWDSLERCDNGGDAGRALELLCAALQSPQCHSLTSLGLKGNQFTAEGGETCGQRLAEALETPHCRLTYLDLSDNELDWTSARFLAGALKSPHCRLAALLLRGNVAEGHANPGGFGGFGRELAEALQSPHCGLTTLDLSSNYMDHSDGSSLAKALRSEHCRLTDLDLSDNSLANPFPDSTLQSGLMNRAWWDDNERNRAYDDLAGAVHASHCRLASLRLANMDAENGLGS